MASVSKLTVGLFFTVILTVFKCVFICGSTAVGYGRQGLVIAGGERIGDAQVMVPWTTVPFLSSTVTVSLESFMRNLTSFMVGVCVGSLVMRIDEDGDDDDAERCCSSVGSLIA